jgi:replicative DNA helicase
MTDDQSVAINAERSVLGAILITCDSWAPEVELLAPGHFSCPVRSRIFEAMSGLHESGEPVDTLTTMGALKNFKDPPGKGWATYLAELAGLCPTAANMGHHADLVLRESRRRDYVDVMSMAIQKARNPGADADEIMTSAMIRLGRISEGRQIVRPRRLGEILKDELSGLDERRRSETPVGHQTGFDELDQLICGLVPGHLIVIAGRPSMGKSSFARNILNRLGSTGIPNLLFSFEMSEEEIGQASVAAKAQVNLQKIRTANLNPLEYDRVVKAMASYHKSESAIIDRPGMAIAEIRTAARSYASQNRLGLIAVDYMQIAVGKGQTREQEIASISRGLKALAKELKIPVIALSQLSRALESRPENQRRPRLSDLRESGAIEQDADEVLFVYRDEYYNPGTKEPGIAEIGVAKSRNGPTGRIKLRWLGEYTKFENLNQEANPELF